MYRCIVITAIQKTSRILKSGWKLNSLTFGPVSEVAESRYSQCLATWLQRPSYLECTFGGGGGGGGLHLA
ncbi:unnamed protein product, partial [Iphiclides podalirius]